MSSTRLLAEQPASSAVKTDIATRRMTMRAPRLDAHPNADKLGPVPALGYPANHRSGVFRHAS
jgi:hypothetical protein